MSKEKTKDFSPFREKLFEIIFHHDTKLGRSFDIVLLVLILVSVMIVMIESVDAYYQKYGKLLYVIEWILTIFFTLEYFVRLWTAHEPKKYAFGFWGIVDLLAIIPTYLSLIIVGSQQLIIIRALRLLRAFRIFRLAKYLKQGKDITAALKASRTKIEIFLYFVSVLVIIIGCVMYLIEGGTNSQFTSIPKSVYWAIVTLTTVGYGDISPATNIGQFFAAVVMILGYAIIAVPTGIVSAEIAKTNVVSDKPLIGITCSKCNAAEFNSDALFCKFCGTEFSPKEKDDYL